MKRRRLVLTVVGIILIILVGLFVIFGIPFIRSTFTPPISGLPTTSASTASGNSLQARYTQTAAAKQAQSTVTPPASS